MLLLAQNLCLILCKLFKVKFMQVIKLLSYEFNYYCCSPIGCLEVERCHTPNMVGEEEEEDAEGTWRSYLNVQPTSSGREGEEEEEEEGSNIDDYLIADDNAEPPTTWTSSEATGSASQERGGAQLDDSEPISDLSDPQAAAGKDEDTPTTTTSSSQMGTGKKEGRVVIIGGTAFIQRRHDHPDFTYHLQLQQGFGAGIHTVVLKTMLK